MHVNPIAHRLDIMKAWWEKAFSRQGVAAVRWFVKPDEVAMVDAFFELEASEHGKLPDLFFRMESPFESAAVFGKLLLKEWTDKFENDHETLAALARDGIAIDCKPQKDLLLRNDIDFDKVFTDQVANFISAIPDFDDNIVLYLAPAAFRNTRNFEKWFLQLQEKKFSPRIKFMLSDSQAAPRYEFLAERMGNAMAVLTPDLQMQDALRQAATAGNPAAPDVQFRKCFFQMADAAAKNNIEDIEFWGSKALEIATRAGWKHLQVTAYMLMAGYLLNFKKYSRSVELYRQALGICEEAGANGDSACDSLSLQCLSLTGAAYTLGKRHDEAAYTYAQMAQKAATLQDWLNAIDGWRMAAVASERNDKLEDAWQYYLNALESGDKLDPAVRKSSGLLFAGGALTGLAKYVRKEYLLEKINNDMRVMAGEDWKDQLEQLNTTNHAGG